MGKGNFSFRINNSFILHESKHSHIYALAFCYIRWHFLRFSMYKLICLLNCCRSMLLLENSNSYTPLKVWCQFFVFLVICQFLGLVLSCQGTTYSIFSLYFFPCKYLWFYVWVCLSLTVLCFINNNGLVSNMIKTKKYECKLCNNYKSQYLNYLYIRENEPLLL